MNRTYDVVVVVAGILGASTAYHLKRNGVERVARVDASRFPNSDSISRYGGEG